MNDRYPGRPPRDEPAATVEELIRVVLDDMAPAAARAMVDLLTTHRRPRVGDDVRLQAAQYILERYVREWSAARQRVREGGRDWSGPLSN